jgi:single-strand DNA-binding protein
MINKVILMGRLCADPDFRQTQNGISICKFRIAINRQYSNNGEQKADFIQVVCWKNTAEFVSRYFRKGSMIIVEGRLQNSDYTDANGVKHYSMNVNASSVSFGESKKAAENSQNAAQQPQGGYQQNYTQQPQNDYTQKQGGYTQPQNYAQPQSGYMQQQVGDLSEFEEILSDGDVPF